MHEAVVFTVKSPGEKKKESQLCLVTLINGGDLGTLLSRVTLLSSENFRDVPEDCGRSLTIQL